MTLTTPSPITDQAAGEPIDMKALVSRFLAWPLPQTVAADGCVTNNAYQFPRSGTNLLNADEAEAMLRHVLAGISAAPTTGSAPVAYMHRNAGPWDLSFADDEGKLREVHTKAIPLYDAPPASPAASVLTDERIAEMAVEHLGIDYDRMPHGVLTLVRAALLAASMGGDRT